MLNEQPVSPWPIANVGRFNLRHSRVSSPRPIRSSALLPLIVSIRVHPPQYCYGGRVHSWVHSPPAKNQSKPYQNQYISNTFPILPWELVPGPRMCISGPSRNTYGNFARARRTQNEHKMNTFRTQPPRGVGGGQHFRFEPISFGPRRPIENLKSKIANANSASPENSASLEGPVL
jgi:hypothetical protein